MASCEKCGCAWIPNSQNVPSSIRSARRSRAVSFSCPCCFAIFSSPPPSLARSRRSWRSSTSGRSRLVGCSVVDMRLLQDWLEHARNRACGLGIDERGDLHADDLALVGYGFEQVVELVRPQATADPELRRHVLGVEDVDIQVDVARCTVARVLNRHERVEARSDNGRGTALERLTLGWVQV